MQRAVSAVAPSSTAPAASRPRSGVSPSPSPRAGATGLGRIIAVGGGKGGVGKSLISTNLAVGMARAGARVVMLDADLGAPNLHSMFGITRPGRTVEDFLHGRSASLDEVMLPTDIPNLRLLAGAEGALGSAHPAAPAKQRLLAHLGRLDADCLVIDVGAGTDIDTIDFFNAADTRLVVMVPEVTSLQNGYAFLKFALFRRLQRAIAGMRASETLSAAFDHDVFELGSSMDRISTFFELLEGAAPELVTHFKLLLTEFNAHLVGNMLHATSDANALFAMQRLIRERLGLDVEIAAALRQQSHVRASVNAGQPFAAAPSASADPNVFEIQQLATRVLRQDLAPLRRARTAFLHAMYQRPLDPTLDAKFSFGLEGVATAPPRKPAQPPPLPPAARIAEGSGTMRMPQPPAPDRELASDAQRLQRVSERVQMFVPIELVIAGDHHCYLAQLVEANEAGGLITGLRAPASWFDARGALRVVGKTPGTTTALGIIIHAVDAARGAVIVRFDDPAAARALVASVQSRSHRPAPPR